MKCLLCGYYAAILNSFFTFVKCLGKKIIKKYHFFKEMGSFDYISGFLSIFFASPQSLFTAPLMPPTSWQMSIRTVKIRCLFRLAVSRIKAFVFYMKIDVALYQL